MAKDALWIRLQDPGSRILKNPFCIFGPIPNLGLTGIQMGKTTAYYKNQFQEMFVSRLTANLKKGFRGW